MMINTTPAGATFVQGFLFFVGIFYIIYLIGYSTFLFLSVAVGASVLYRRKREDRFKGHISIDCYVPVTIVVPAHNESITIVDSLRSLLELEYSLYEIVVVDDGSSDDTVDRVVEAFDLHEISRPVRYQVPCNRAKRIWDGTVGKISLTLVTKDNGGKSDALNMGINVSRYPYFICIDADSMLQRDSLREITAPLLEGDGVVAVGGLVRPSNGVGFKDGMPVSHSLPNKVIPAMQVLEYDRSFLSARILFDQFNGNLIISGAFGLFRKDVVIAVGGYDRTTVGEDMELVTRLHAFCRASEMDYRIRYAQDAVCWTQAPETLRDLCAQRRRWHRGLKQCMGKYRRVFSGPRYGLVGLVSFSYFFIYELLSPFIELFGIFTIAVACVFGFVNVPFMIAFFLIYAVFGAVMSLTAFFSRIQARNLTLSTGDAVRAVFLSLFEITVLRFVLATTRMVASFGRSGAGLRWEKVERRKLGSD